MLHEYRKGKLVVRWDASSCTHSGNCNRGLREVFDVSRKPWVDLNAAAPERVVEQIKRCPSGALTFEILKQEE